MRGEDAMRSQICSGVLVGALTLLASSASAIAQPEVLKPLHLSHGHGYVLSESGKPVAGVQVALVSGGSPSQATNTDADGHFDFPDAEGEHLFHVNARGSAIAARQVMAGAGLRATFPRGPLHVMMRPGNCEDCTSPILTSKKQFDRAIRENTGTE